VLLLGALPTSAQDVLSQLSLTSVATGLDLPVAITHAPGDPDRLFITLLEGRVVVLEDGEVRGQPFLDLRDRVLAGGEGGLLSIAFHPNFAQNRFLYANYTNLGGHTAVSRFRATADLSRADATSEAVLFQVQQPFGNHNGGQLQFGPDGRLYIGMGDGGSGDDPLCAGQRTDTLLGKMLRLDVNASGAQPEIWASGLRNPWRFSFDRQTGDLYIADVGQRQREEVNFQPAGAGPGRNYGWKIMEGTLCRGSQAGCPNPVPGCNAPAYTPPVLEYDHGGGRCSVTGG
jgi:glucose/arabinose dehydrogenase